MTVAELKRALADAPDDANVVILEIDAERGYQPVSTALAPGPEDLEYMGLAGNLFVVCGEES